MNRIFLAAAPLAIGAGALAARRERARHRTARLMQEEKLLASALARDGGTVNFAELDRLPAPVARYFRYALQDGQPVIRVARFHQTGRLRASAHSHRWLAFRADQLVVPSAHGFLWKARVGLGASLPIHVSDGYQAGEGDSQVSLLSAFVLAARRGRNEMHAAALHRYLAEAVWYPTALLPSAGVRWKAIDERRALASLSDAGMTVSLEFRFAPSGEVAGIYTPGRWRSIDRGFCLTPWEGRFDGHIELTGMRVPACAEVGWYVGGYVDGQWRPVWEGCMDSLVYELAA